MKNNYCENQIARDQRTYFNFLHDRLTCVVRENEAMEDALSRERFLRRLYMWAFYASFIVSLFFALSALA